MNKIEITKAIVNNLTGFSVGAAASVFLDNHRRHSDNRLIETTIDASVAVTSLAVGGMAHQAVRTYTDTQIDKAFAWYNDNFKK